jgi:hypothetical protein
MKSDRLVVWLDGRRFQEDTAISKMAERFRAATAAYDAGDYESGIARLREAYAIAARAGVGCETPECLRLPRYLRKAGRSAEAWNELQALLSPAHPTLRYGEYDFALNHSRIYDGMRLFLQREGRPALASCYSVLSYVFEAENRYANIADLKAHHVGAKEERKRLREYRRPDVIESNLYRHLKKADLLSRLGALVSWVRPCLETRPLPSGDTLLVGVRGVLNVAETYP